MLKNCTLAGAAAFIGQPLAQPTKAKQANKLSGTDVVTFPTRKTEGVLQCPEAYSYIVQVVIYGGP